VPWIFPGCSLSVPSFPAPQERTIDKCLRPQLGVVKELTEIVAAAAGDESLIERTWVLLTESPEGGWGIAGHAHTNADIAATARAALAG
jgi:phenylpyruvate tautomerase PptA (4-oxalocrotonate tautomerase family)